MTTTYMNLALPVVGTTVGPTYASGVNAALTAVDSHNHSTGQGVAIPTAGLNINAGLSFNSFDASDLRATRFDSQASALAASVITAVYSVNGDLYWNNESGTAVQVTNGTSVAGAAGNISGMDATSALTYSTVTKVFTFTQSSGFPAKVACGDLQIFETVAAAAQAVTIKVPTSFAAGYDLTLPAALGATNTLLQMSSAGVLSALAAPAGTSLLQQTSGGVLSWTTSLPSGLTIPAPNISAPVLSGTATGTYTLGGTPTIAAPELSGTVTGTYALGGTPTIVSPTITGRATLNGVTLAPNTIVGFSLSAVASLTITVATTVDADSASGQKVLSVTATADLLVAGQPVIINEGGAREETGVIDSVDDGVSITLVGDLTFEHTAVQADRVCVDYRDIRVEIRRYIPAVDDRDIWVRFNGISTNTYVHRSTAQHVSAGVLYSASTGSSSIVIGTGASNRSFGANANEVGDVTIDVLDFQDSTKTQRLRFQADWNNGGNIGAWGGGDNTALGPVDSITLIPESGNIGSALITVSGVRHA